MSVELLQTMSLVSYIIAGVLFLIAIALFFLLDIPKLVGDITGANERKAIELIRQQNESTGNKAYKPSPVNSLRGKLTDKISPSGRLEAKTSGIAASPGTQKFSTVELMPPERETTLLSASSSETTVLAPEFAATSETTILSQTENLAVKLQTSEMVSHNFVLEVEMSFIGSLELIE